MAWADPGGGLNPEQQKGSQDTVGRKFGFPGNQIAEDICALEGHMEHRSYPPWRAPPYWKDLGTHHPGAVAV
jgi:hypothetical protein